MTWEELRVLLNSYHADGEKDILAGKVSITSTDSFEYLDLVQSMTKDTLTFVADWNYSNSEDDDG